MFFYIICLFVPVFIGMHTSAKSAKFTTNCPFTSMEWHIFDREKNIEAIFNPCGFLTDNICGPKKQACVKFGKTVLFDGSQFVTGDNGNLVIISSKSSQCSLTILPECSQNLQVLPTLRKTATCSYEVKLLPLMCPNPKCTFKFHNHLIDLRSLKRRHIVQSKNKTYSIDLCDINTDCGTFKASSCDITDKNNIIPLSSTNEFFKYNEDLHQVEKHGLFKGIIPNKKNEKKFELIIKCDWNTNSSEIRYKEVQTQGKNYKFEMKSSFACVKVPPKCEVGDKFYIYNLTSLQSTTNWNLGNVAVHQSRILLNICGPLQFGPPVSSENHCSRSFSQVCMITNEEFINMGSIQTELIVAHDVVTTTFISGDTCNNESTIQYSTYLELKCSKTEEYPIFRSLEECRLFVTWNTPAACPINNKRSCENISRIFMNTTFQISNNIYNLSSLYRENGKNSLRSGDIEYMFNIGGPVVDDDAPCKKNMVVALKNLTTNDIRRRVKSLGHMKKFFENDNGQLVIENDGGDFSTQFQNYYKSTIIFECCNGNCQEDIKLLNRTGGTFEFVWKTPAACPRKVIPSSCLFERLLDNDYLYDFSTLRKTDLTLNISGSRYLFDICQNNQSKCDKKGCIYVPVNKYLVTYENKTHLEFILNETCAVNNFNKALFELVCDRILNNDHFVFKALENCTLLFQLKTYKACSEEELFVSLDKNKVKNNLESPSRKHSLDTINQEVDTGPQKSDVVRQEGVHETGKVVVDNQPNANPVEKYDMDVIKYTSVVRNLDNCSVINHNTGYQFNISSLKLNVSSSDCPKIVFNDFNQSVSLLYSSKNPCGKSGTFNYAIVMKCQTGTVTRNTTKSGHCLETFILELPEACKLLETTILNNNRISTGNIAGITVGTLVVILFLVGISILLVRKYRSVKERDAYTMTLYEKMD